MATYDPALREAIARTPNRRYTSYWLDHGKLSTDAEQLRLGRGIIKIRGDADHMLGRLANAVQSLVDRRARHHLALPAAASAAKRELADQTVAIPLHDQLATEFAKLSQHPDLAWP